MAFEEEPIMQLLEQSKGAAEKLIAERNYLRNVAFIDPLTGLNNRNALSRIRDFTGIMMLDVDDFKSINDTYGHDKGDEVLQKIASILLRTTRAKDCLCRLGGDEFMAVFVECPHDVIRDRARVFGKTVADTLMLEDPIRQVTTSIGYAFNERNESLDQVLKHADLALYESKRQGKNRVTEFKAQLPMVIPEPYESISIKH
ncbi:MAG: GGDEF domain-containing protein [Bacilli bacterium]|nr:GGDEF domain-containing protein [Bacilli bacterium]